ncbi:PD-(D/E)XK nuclease-like domain-containing protein [Shewanella sp. T24-MNA-CIBAN-0130]|uniref:PD-(D/E)XK nuclease-like domain-containing protein n=1 Tax=Shewanella sp. T24-MNA-CIBAN-0130 TaxID=3140470 RepID=UPI00331ED343
MQTYYLQFNPKANAPGGTFKQLMAIDAKSLDSAMALAEKQLREDGIKRKHFMLRVAVLTKDDYEFATASEPVEDTVAVEAVEAVEPKKQAAPKVSPAAKAEPANDDSDPFAQFVEAAKWTVEKLNTKLEMLPPGERLVIDNLDDEIYHSCIGVSTSKLKMFIQCPKKFKAHYIDCIIPRTEKAYFDMGKAIHTLTLQPWLFASSYIEQAEDIKVRNGKKWDEFKAAAGNKVVLTKAQWAEMPIMRQSLENEPTALALTKGGVAEQSYFMRDVETGLIVKCRPDYKIGDLIIDLKSAASAAVKDIRWNFKKLGYHIQDALYTEVSQAKEFAFLVVESSAPFVWVGPVAFDEEAKRFGYLKYRKALRELKQCMETDIWPGYTDEMVTIELNKFESDELEALETEQAQAEYEQHSHAA